MDKDKQLTLWLLFYAVDWKQAAKDATFKWYKEKFPELHKIIDEAKYHYDVAQAIPNDKNDLVGQSIKTEFGRKLIAKFMCGSIRDNLNYYKL